MRVALYRRVSTDDQVDGYSLDAQLRALRQHCADRGWEIVDDYVEEGKSARTDDVRKRPRFQEMLVGAERHAFDVVVVHKLDRFSRNLRITLESFDHLGRFNVGFVSLVEQIDYSTPQGKLFLHMLAALAQFYSDNLSQETKKGKRERKAQGFYNGLVPFGMVKDEKSRLPVPDRRVLPSGGTNFDGLLLAFRTAAEGASDAAVAKALNAAGYRTTGNRGANLWRKDTVRRVLTNRFYLGELPDGKGGWLKGKHEAVLPADLFDTVQSSREENRKEQRARAAASSRRTYSLTGLLRCWYCEQGHDKRRGPMRISTDDATRARCAARIDGLGCEQRSLPLEMIEEQVGEWIAQIEVPPDGVETALAQLAKQNKEVPSGEQDRRRLETRLERIKELYTWGDKDRASYLAERDEITRQIRALQPAREQKRDLERLANLMRSAPAVWRGADASARNQLAVKLIAKVVIKDHRVESIHPRPDVAMWAPVWKPSPSSGGSDGDQCPARTGRYLRPHNILPADILAQIAATARASSISDAARVHGVARQTVRRALSLTECRRTSDR